MKRLIRKGVVLLMDRDGFVTIYVLDEDDFNRVRAEASDDVADALHSALGDTLEEVPRFGDLAGFLTWHRETGRGMSHVEIVGTLSGINT